MPSSRLKNWNTMPMWRRRMRASSSSLLPGDLLAGDHDLAVVGDVEAGDQVEQRRLAAARRAHDRDELAVAERRGRRRAAHAPARARPRTSCAHPAPSAPVPSVPSDMLRIDARYATTGVSRPFTSCASSGRIDAASAQRLDRLLAQHGRPGRAREVLQPLRQVHGVADDRVLEPLVAPEQRGRDLAGRQPDAEPERLEPFGLPRRVRPRPDARASRPRPRRPARAWSSCGNGAPNTAITASPTYCITVPPWSRIAAFISARCVLSWPASTVGSRPLGDARVAAHVGHQHGDVEPLGPPDRVRSSRSFSASPPGRRRLSVSPCSSRSTIAFCRSRSRRSAPSRPALAPWRA